jgi:hypothetical protein
MEQDAIYAFDTLYTNRQIQMLKLSMPLLPSVYGSFLAIYIKFLELHHTIGMAKNARFSASAGIDNADFSLDSQSMEQYFNSITPYLSDDDKGKIQKIKNMLQTMEQFKQMKPILDMMSQTDNTADDNYMEILKNFLSEEQLFMFEMFNAQK